MVRLYPKIYKLTSLPEGGPKLVTEPRCKADPLNPNHYVLKSPTENTPRLIAIQTLPDKREIGYVLNTEGGINEVPFLRHYRVLENDEISPPDDGTLGKRAPKN